MNKPEFSLWLEFEIFEQGTPWDSKNEFFNMHIVYQEQTYALNVWSFGYLQKELKQEKDEMNGFISTPDLLVTDCTRAHMDGVVSRLIIEELIKEEWLVGDSQTTAL